MSSRNYQLFIVILTLLCVLLDSDVHAQNTAKHTMSDFASKNRIIMYWDLLSKTGMLSKGNTIVTFSVGIPVMLLNFQQKFEIDAPVLDNVGVTISEKTLVLLRKLFEKETGISRSAALNRNEGSTRSARNYSQSGASESFLQDTGVPNFAKSKVRKIIIDPGHGGKDPGGIGYINYNNKKITIKEKDVVLHVATLIQKYLQQSFPKLSIVLTRDDDTYLSLEQRTLLANKSFDKLESGELILFISVHANASPSAAANGYEIWYLPSSYYRDDLVNDDVKNNVLYSIINSLRNSEITLESFELAKLVLQSLEDGVSKDFKNRGLKENEWYVVRNAKMPAILLELGFVTNEKEGYALSQKNYQDTLARYIAKGIVDYMELFDVTDIKSE